MRQQKPSKSQLARESKTFTKRKGGARPPAERDARLPAVGSVITKEWRERTLRVTVTDEGFRFEGKAWPSLSSIARHLLGCEVNGFAFFGLLEKPKAARASKATAS